MSTALTTPQINPEMISAIRQAIEARSKKGVTATTIAIIGLCVNTVTVLGGLIWGTSKMSTTIDMLKEQQMQQTIIDQKQTDALATLAETVAILRDRSDRIVIPYLQQHGAIR